MKKALGNLKDMAEAISKAYPDYWPLTLNQVYYYLLKMGKIGDGGIDWLGYQAVSTSTCDDKIDPRVLINHSPGPESPFLEFRSQEDRKVTYRRQVVARACAIPAFEIWKEQKNHVELWVNDAELTEFLRIHMDQEIPVPVYDTQLLFDPGPFIEMRARLDYMRKVERKSIIVLYLSDFDLDGFETHTALKTPLEGEVDAMVRIGMNHEHTAGLPRKPALFYDTDRLKDERQFEKQLGCKGSYSVHALEPSVLLDLVSRAVSAYYDREKYPHDTVARWRKAQGTLKQSLEGVLDELLELAA